MKIFPYKKFILIGGFILLILVSSLVGIPHIFSVKTGDYILFSIYFVLGSLLTIGVIKGRGYVEVKK